PGSNPGFGGRPRTDGGGPVRTRATGGGATRAGARQVSGVRSAPCGGIHGGGGPNAWGRAAPGSLAEGGDGWGDGPAGGRLLGRSGARYGEFLRRNSGDAGR